MRTRSPHHADVFSHLPVSLMRALDTAQVSELLERLLDAGWRSGQLRHRVGSEPSQGSTDRDAAHLQDLLGELLAQTPPDVAHAAAVAERDAQRAREREDAPVPASPQVRARALASIRSELRGAPRRRPGPEPRTRPACSLCDGEGAFFVTRDVHLCGRCVAVLATGEARLSQTG